MEMKKTLIRALMSAASGLPLAVHRFNAVWIAFLMRKVIRYRADVSLTNIRNSFPEKSEAEIKTIYKRFYRHLARIITETVWFGGCHNGRRLFKSGIVHLTNPGLIQELYDKYPSVIILYSHMGNWELLGGLESFNHTEEKSPFTLSNSCFVYRKLKDKVWDDIFRENRYAPYKGKTDYSTYLETMNVLRFILSHKDSKFIYNMNTDQWPYVKPKDQIKVNFLNRITPTMSGGAAIARKLSLPVVFLSMMERKDGNYDISFRLISENASEMSEEEIMNTYYRHLEADIRLQPETYLWSHKRWKKY